MAAQVPRFQQPDRKVFAARLVFAIQRFFPLRVELSLAKLALANRAFLTLRDCMVSDRIQAIYFPIPKSACTLFATFIALNSDHAPDFNAGEHKIHSYRLKNRNLQLNDVNALVSDRFFRFTVIRDPFTRLVSGYVDKLVKPVRNGLSWGTYERCGKFSFEEVVESICNLSDAELEKHFRPQITFIRNVPMDHIGLFEHLELTFDVLKERFGVDVRNEVAEQVHSPKRTGYEQGASTYVGALRAAEISKREGIPPIEAFYNEDLRRKVAVRFKEDFDLYQRVRDRLKV